MTIGPLQTLIDKQDGFELIREQIAALLVFERDNQMTLAAAASKDPNDWNFRVYIERSDPWEQNVLSDNPTAEDLRPIVNIWFDSDTFSASSSNVAETQKCTATYNIDVYGFGVSKSTQAGHDPADMVAASERDRAVRLVRNILQASQNAYLQLPRGTAWDRKIESRQAYQPRLDQQTHIQTVATRMRFNVSFNETSPQYQGVPLANLVATTKRASDGQVILDLSYVYTP